MLVSNLSTPIVLIIFNRPELTTQVFREIAKVRPSKLFVISDGPRTNRVGELEKVLAARSLINDIDWNCEVFTNFSDENLGCKKRISSGLDWVFNQVESAIILEDDCLPAPSFFPFCEELLKKYKDDDRVGMIGGSNFQFGRRVEDSDYYFSKYMHIWGWATWRRCWQHYDVNASIWPKFHKEGWLDGISQTQNEKHYWQKAFNNTYLGKIDTWDYQWVLTAWAQSWVSIVPNVNLIKNIGFGVDATHTKGASALSNMQIEDLKFPLTHPIIHTNSYRADRYTASLQYNSSIMTKVYRKLGILLKNVFKK